MITPLELAQRLKRNFPEILSDPHEFRREATLELREPGQIVHVCAWAKRELNFDYLVDIASVDHWGREPRFTVVYELYGLGHRCYLRLKVDIDESTGELPSVAGVWRTANWHEREIFDMMGIRFSGHPDLRRILMWEGYPFFPLRKDFPLEGRPSEAAEVAFSEAAPLDGGPFVTRPGPLDATRREPRARPAPPPGE